MGGQGAEVGAGAGPALAAPGPSPSLAGRGPAPGQGGGTPSPDQGPEAEVGRRRPSQSRDPAAGARDQSRGPSPSRGPDPSRRQRGRPAGERVRREMLRSPRATPNLGPGHRQRKMEIQGGPSPRDQIVAMHLLRRTGMEMKMETIDHNTRKKIEGHFFLLQYSHKLSVRCETHLFSIWS